MNLFIILMSYLTLIILLSGINHKLKKIVKIRNSNKFIDTFETLKAK